MKNKRFEIIYKEGSMWSWEGKKAILRDNETGIQYLIVWGGMAHCITPLLDEKGKVITDTEI